MEVTFAFLCDYADFAGGKLAAFGIGIDTIYAPKVPATHPLLFAVISIRFTVVEVGTKQVGIRVIDADGQQIIPALDATVSVEPPPSGTYKNHRIALALYSVMFPRYGDYSVRWVLDGQEISQMPLRIATPPELPTTV